MRLSNDFVTIVKWFITESVYTFSNTTKSFLIPLLVGFYLIMKHKGKNDEYNKGRREVEEEYNKKHREVDEKLKLYRLYEQYEDEKEYVAEYYYESDDNNYDEEYMNHGKPSHFYVDKDNDKDENNKDKDRDED